MKFRHIKENWPARYSLDGFILSTMYMMCVDDKWRPIASPFYVVFEQSIREWRLNGFPK